MSPFNSIISLTNFDEIIWFSGSDIKKTVSTKLFNFLFIPANWNSYSKSEVARKPLIMIVALYLEHNDVVKVLKDKTFSSLTTDLCKKYRSTIILRGLRAVSDFEYEFQLAGMNRKLNNNIETVFLMSDVENQIISSRFVKEIVKLKGDIKKFTTKSTIKLLKKKYE